MKKIIFLHFIIERFIGKKIISEKIIICTCIYCTCATQNKRKFVSIGGSCAVKSR